MIIDAHIHNSPEFCGEDILNFMDRTQTDRAVLQAVYHTQVGPLAPAALALKKTHPDRIFVFGAPDARLYFTEAEHIGAAQVSYLKPLVDAGMDGIKLLEGKPQMRKAYPIPPFDSEAWEPFFAWLERERIPVMWHVNDPAAFWAKDTSPWLKKQGWAYDDSFINNEAQYAEVLRVLKRHPRLRAVFAHCFFMSDSLERLSGILDAYPEVRIDLTPGIEMYENFSKAPGQAAAFFTRYGERILYGTDIGGRCVLTNEGCPFNERENLLRPQIVRAFLTGTEEREITSDGDYIIGRELFTLKPLGLTGAAAERVLGGNALTLIQG